MKREKLQQSGLFLSPTVRLIWQFQDNDRVTLRHNGGARSHECEAIQPVNSDLWDVWVGVITSCGTILATFDGVGY